VSTEVTGGLVRTIRDCPARVKGFDTDILLRWEVMPERVTESWGCAMRQATANLYDQGPDTSVQRIREDHHSALVRGSAEADGRRAASSASAAS